jgi:hypothetical protein
MDNIEKNPSDTIRRTTFFTIYVFPIKMVVMNDESVRGL